MLNLSSLSKEELDQNLRALREGSAQPAADSDRLQQTVQELEVHRIELEMQNRALQETQTELEQSVQRYADLYDHLPLAYVTVTPNGQIVGANRAACEWLHRDCRALVGNFLARFLDPYDGGRLAAHLENCVKSGQRSTLELTFRPRENETVAVQLSSRVAPATAATELQIHIAITDISKLKRAQTFLEEINREQEAFNYSISHDLRAPLVTINNYASIVLSEHGERMDDDGKAMVERIRCAALRMEETLKHLLEYSTMAREEIVLESVSIEQIVADLLIEHRTLIQEKAAQIEVARPLPAVRGTKTMLTQVFANLLTNALKYTAPGAAPQIRISAEVTDQKVVISVTDRGIGIDAKYHERVFKIFERLHGYSRYPGSGVGLAIARRAMERMNGRIWVQSELGKGSCFYLELPKA
jgi:PAS domain S-box-containing protein